MKTLSKVACPAFAFSAFAVIAMTGSPVRNGASASNYCMRVADNEPQCDFTTLAQCKVNASGLDGQCYRGPVAREVVKASRGVFKRGH